MSFFKTAIAKMRRKPSCSKLSEILLSCSNSEIRFCFRSDKNKDEYLDCCTTAKETTEICRILGNIDLCSPESAFFWLKTVSEIVPNKIYRPSMRYIFFIAKAALL